jgi:hypothetical protein
MTPAKMIRTVALLVTPFQQEDQRIKPFHQRNQYNNNSNLN